MRFKVGIIAVCVLAVGIAASSQPAYAFTCASYTDLAGAGNEEWGNSAGNFQKTAQEFTVSATCYITALQVYSEVVGSPVDNATFSVYSESGGIPNTLLETGGIPATFSSSSYSWVSSAFTQTTLLSPGTNYFVVLDRTGSQLTSERWQDRVNDVSIPDTQTLNWNGSSWANQNAGYEMNYEIDGESTAAGGGGGGGGSGVVEATSSPDQIQSDWLGAMVLYFASMVFIVWLFRNRSL